MHPSSVDDREFRCLVGVGVRGVEGQVKGGETGEGGCRKAMGGGVDWVSSGCISCNIGVYMGRRVIVEEREER